MDYGTTEAEPADIAANKDASTPVEDSRASDIESEVVEPVEGNESDQSLAAEAISGPLSQNSEDEPTISTDEEQLQPKGAEQNRKESSSLSVPELIIDSSSAVDSVDDSEIQKGMEMGSSVSEDVISPEEAYPNMPKGSEGTPETDANDCENTPVIENIINAVGGTGCDDPAAEGLDSAAETVVDSENQDGIDSNMKEGENSPTESDDAANLNHSVHGKGGDELSSNEEDPTAIQDVEVREGTVEEPRGDDLGEKSADVMSDGPSTGSGATDTVDEDQTQKPDLESEPLVLEDARTPDAEHSAFTESAKDADTDVVEEVSQQDEGEAGVAYSMGTPANVEGGSNDPLLESGAEPDGETLEAEAVESSLTADVGDSAEESQSSPTVSGEDGKMSTMDEERGGEEEASPEIDPIRLASGEDKQTDTKEQAEPEGEDKLPLDSDGKELVQGAVTGEFPESGAVNEDGQRAILGRTDTIPSNSAEIAEVSEADEGLVEDVGHSPDSLTETEEIVEVVTNDQDASTSGVETAEEEQVQRPDGDIECPVEPVPDASVSSPLASADITEDSTVGDAAEYVENNDASQVSSTDLNEVVGGVTLLDAPTSSMEEAEEEQVAELESGVDAPAVVTEGGENADASSPPNLDTEETVEVMSKEQDAPTPSIEEAGEEHVAGTDGEVETPGRVDPDATEISSPSTDDVAESFETVEAIDVLGNTDSQNVVVSDSNENVEGLTDDREIPTAAMDLREEEKEAETVRETESPGETSTDAMNTEQEPSGEIPEGLTVGSATEVADKEDEPIVSSSNTTETEGKFEQDEPTSGSEIVEEKQVAGTDTGAPYDTDMVPDSVEMSSLIPKSSDVSGTGDELVDTADDLHGSIAAADKVGRNQQDDPVSGMEVDGEVDAPGTAPDATRAGLLNSAKIHPEVLETHDLSDFVEKADASHLTSDNVDSKEVVLDEHDAPNTTGDESGLILAKDGDDELSSISPGKVEFDMGQEDQVTDSVGNGESPSLEDALPSASGPSEEPEEEKKVLACEDSNVGYAGVSERDLPVGDAHQISLSCTSSNLDETLAPEKEQEREVITGSDLGNELVEMDESAQGAIESPQEPEGAVAILNDHQQSTLVQDEQVPEKEASGVVTGYEDLVGGSESSAARDVSEIKPVDYPEDMIVEEAPVSMTPDVVSIQSTLSAERAELPEAEETELPYSGPADQNTASYSEREKDNLMLATESAVATPDLVSEDSLKGDSQKDTEVGETGSDVKGLAEATPDVPRESESLKDIILEHGSEPQELMRVVAETSSSPAIEEDTPTEVKVPEINETSNSRESSLQNDTPLQTCTAAEKVISTTDVKNVSAPAELQEDSVDKGDFPRCSFPTPSSGAEESLEAKESSNGTDKLPEGSTQAVLYSSGPSAHADTHLGDGDVEQKEISGHENISVNNVVTADLPVDSVKPASVSLPRDNETKNVTFKGLQSVYSPDKLQMGLASLNTANVAAKEKEDFLKEGEIHPMKRQHLIHASKGSTLASSGDVDAFQKSPDTVDSSRRGVSAAESPIISQGGDSVSAIETESTVGTLKSPKFRTRSAPKDEASVPLSTYSGDLSSSWVPVPLASASEVHPKSEDSEEKVIEKQMPRLRAVARGGEDRRAVSERDVPTASITPAKASDPVPKSRAQIIHNEDLNDAKFPLSIMLWCSQSLSSLFGSAKSL